MNEYYDSKYEIDDDEEEEEEESCYIDNCNNMNIIECNNCEKYYCTKHINRIINLEKIAKDFYNEKEIGYFCEDCYQKKLKNLIEK